ncbi:MAG: PD40 domain-containing protein [Phycisphaeraceae bacterium]|nr:PD40 domain-containing protein [Phycisphaeraceae bacterium]
MRIPPLAAIIVTLTLPLAAGLPGCRGAGGDTVSPAARNAVHGTRAPGAAPIDGVEFARAGGGLQGAAERPTPASRIYGEFAADLQGSSSPEVVGALVQVTASSDGACFHPDVDRSGRWIVYASTQHSERANIYMKAVDGRTQRQITVEAADDEMPVISPCGRRIAFASNRFGDWDLFITSVDGGPAIRVTESADHEVHPSFAPDGRRLAYARLASHTGRWEIWMVDLETNVHQFLAYGLFPRWNPDPAVDRIVYQRARERGSRFFSIWTLDLVGGEATNKTEIVSAANAAIVQPAWSPDGQRIAFCSIVDPETHGDAQPRRADLWVVSADGTGRINLTGGIGLNLFPVWASNGTIYFLSDRGGSEDIWALDTGRASRLGRALPSGTLTQVDPSE